MNGDEDQLSMFDSDAPTVPAIVNDPTVNTEGYVGRNNPETSAIAAVRQWPRSGIARRRILDFILGAGDSGAIDEEIQAALHMHANTETPRRLDLVRGDWIYDSGERRLTRSSSSPAIVWKANDRARAWANRQEVS